MSASAYTAIERRAANQVWNAAGRYDFEPLFLAIHTSEHRPDFYMNLIIGLSYKYYGEKTLTELFDKWNGDIHQEMLDDLSWLYLEHAVFTLEQSLRPVLAELRTAYARDFFAGEYKLSRQEWMNKNHLVYDLQSARWDSVLGRKLPFLTPTEHRLLQALTPAHIASEKHLEETLLEIFRNFLLFDGKKQIKKPLKLHFTGAFARLLTRIKPVELVKTDRVSVMRSSQADSDQGDGFLQAKSNSHIIASKKDTDRLYIESCFGQSLYSPQVRSKAEKELCTGNHSGCHIWITNGTASSGRKLSAENRYLIQQAELQQERNKTYYYKNQALHKMLISHLSEQIRNCMLVHQQPDVLPGRNGKLDPTRVWRASCLNDTRIFHSSQDDNQASFTTDLLLDASASRLQYQEQIAAQGMILAESLRSCAIPVRISEFCSVRGYTVLRILKSFEAQTCDSVFQYFATGWNRDGLAMRLMDNMLHFAPGPADRHLIILLTDAAPNDSFKIHASSDAPFGQDYGEKAGVLDTATEVHALQQRGIHVSAVFMGTDAAVSNADKIYGKNYTRIRNVSQLAEAAGYLIQKEIQSLND